jgi:pyruvate dehydrogenase E1 component subunit alpha
MSPRKAAPKRGKLAQSAEQLGSFLYQMLLIRRFENKTAEMYTKGKVRGFLHLYNGEEACGVGAINALGERDKIVTHYRDHGHALARGLEPNRIMAELFGRVDGTNGGRGGSMHLFDAEKGFLGGYAIVAGHMPVAVGLGLASNLDDDDFVTMCIFGDGGVGEGEFHEALNLAAIWKTPVIFFCENNGYGMGVPFADSLANSVHKIAAAYNMPSVLVDGMDVMAVHEATKKAVAHCRAGKGPYFIEAETYRFRGHSMADPELYRSKEEVAERRKDDPIEQLKAHMMKAGMLDGGGFEELVARAEKTVLDAVAFAEASPEPSLASLHDYVTKEPANG